MSGGLPKLSGWPSSCKPRRSERAGAIQQGVHVPLLLSSHMEKNEAFQLISGPLQVVVVLSTGTTSFKAQQALDSDANSRTCHTSRAEPKAILLSSFVYLLWRRQR